MFGTIVGIVGSFKGCGCEASAHLAALNESLSESIWPTALGLLVGLISLWCYRYLAGRLETIDHEMDNGSLALLNQLTRYSGRFIQGPAIDRISANPMFGETSFAELSPDQKSLPHYISLEWTPRLRQPVNPQYAVR